LISAVGAGDTATFSRRFCWVKPNRLEQNQNFASPKKVGAEPQPPEANRGLGAESSELGKFLEFFSKIMRFKHILNQIFA